MNGIPKARPCKVCKARFKPVSVYEWWCPAHETAYKSSQLGKQRQQQSASRQRSLKKLKQATPATKRKTKTVIKTIRACKPSAADYGKPCISCGQPMADSGFSKMECGHYRSRGAAIHLRFHLHNMNGQCHHCNQVLSGNREGFMLGLTARRLEKRRANQFEVAA